MSVELSDKVNDILNQIEELDESEQNQVLDELIEKEPEFQDIHDRLIDGVSTRIPELPSLRPHSKTMRNTKITALTHFEFNDKGVKEVKKQMHPSTATGEWLDEHGGDIGLVRKTLVKATGTVLTGSSVLPDATYTLPELFMAGTVGSEDEESVKFVGLTTPSIDPSQEADEDGDYTVEVQIEAEKGGASANLDPNMILEIFTKVPYFDLVKQKNSTTGGYNHESDDDFRKRILDKKKEIAEYTPPWFRNQALTITGVGDAIIIPVIYGEGTIGIAIKGTGTTIPQSLIDEVQAHFDTETIKPLANWRAFVSAIATYDIDIQVDVYHKAGLSVQEDDILSAVESYFSALSIGDSFVLQMMETKIGLVNNVYNFKTMAPTDDIIDSPNVSTLIVLGTAGFNLIEVA